MSHRPNILLIYPDQMRADAISCAGNPCIKTPSFDRLAYEGVRFSDAFTSFPLCSPFRASLMTGKYAHSTGIYANHYPIPLGQEFLAEIFRDAGYQAGYVGKWHLDGGVKHGLVPPGPRRLGFDYFVGFNRGHEYMHSIYYYDTDQPYTSKRYQPDYQTDHLIRFMEQCLADPGGHPFLGMICYGLPHPPLVAPRHYLELYSPDEVPIPDNVPKDPESQQRARQFLAKYYGLVACVDHNVGRVLDWLDAHDIADDTLVLMVSDHGDLAGEHERYSKKIFYRNSMQVPMIVRYPRAFPGNRVVGALVDPSTDTMPTLLELCGIPVPESVQGVSYLSLLQGDPTPTREAIYYEILMEREGPEKFPVPERGVRTKDWLYVRRKDGITHLFDLRNDPLEMHNLASSAQHEGVIEKLDGMLTAHMQRTGDDWDIEAVFPPPDFQTHEEGRVYARELLKRAIVEP
ncbi:MAG: sulfatase [Candidatus Hydrogenedentota bacterium]|nr:MAG: sulfatase [Candidatus Hydrogenedentota bacterium]